MVGLIGRLFDVFSLSSLEHIAFVLFLSHQQLPKIAGT
jgi:hypothetical protein